MPIDRSFFITYDDLKVGDRVKWVMKRGLSGGQGTVKLIWIGIEEMCDIETDYDEKVTVCRALGDTVEKL